MPERVLYRAGRVLTTPGRDEPPATALLTEDGVVRWAGEGDPPADAVVDLGDALLLPAFTDAHVHVTETGLLLDGVDLTGAPSVTAILDLVAAAARRRPGRAVIGHGWDDLLLAEGRAPTLAELERAAPGCAVYLSRVDVHSALVSGTLAERHGLAALEGWDASGRVERDAHHAARHATRHALPAAERRELQEAALRSAAAAGIACVHEMSAPHVAPEEDLAALIELAASPGLPEVVPYRGELVSTPADALALVGKFGVAGLAGDLVVDGSVGSGTASFHEPYADAPGHGFRYLTDEEIAAHLLACSAAGVQAGFHVIGDAAVDAVVAGLGLAAAELGEEAVRRARHRLEHAELVRPAAVAALARHGVVLSVQPAFDAAWGGPAGMYATRLGPERALAMNPFAAFAAAGVPMLFGSDSPVTPFDPWGAVRAATHHLEPRHRLDAATALAAHVPGTLAPGRPATFAAWTGSLDPADSADPAGRDCLLTVRGGVRLWSASS